MLDPKNLNPKPAAGEVEWRAVLKDFWAAFEPAVAAAYGIEMRDVIDTLDAVLGPHLFPAQACPPISFMLWQQPSSQSETLKAF